MQPETLHVADVELVFFQVRGDQLGEAAAVTVGRLTGPAEIVARGTMDWIA